MAGDSVAIEEITYTNAIVTFLDILGFKDIVQNSSVADITSRLNAVELFVKPIGNQGEAHEPYVHIFSDAIVRIRPVDTAENREYRIGLLFQEIIDLVHILGELIPHDVILRGAVSYGQTFASKTRVFGPGLIRAYELESNCAVYPRVIIDPDLLTEFEENPLLQSAMNNYADDKKEIYDLLQQGADGFWFIDYLKVMNEEIGNPDVWMQFLLDHKNLAVKGAKSQVLPGTVMQKYMWLAGYQNHVVQDIGQSWFQECNRDINEFLLTEKDIPTLKNTGTALDETSGGQST